jgi:hypothetical protein
MLPVDLPTGVDAGIIYLIRKYIEKPLRRKFAHIRDVRVSWDAYAELLQIRVVTDDLTRGSAYRYYQCGLGLKQIYAVYAYAGDKDNIATLVSLQCEDIARRFAQMIRADMGSVAYVNPRDYGDLVVELTAAKITALPPPKPPPTTRWTVLAEEIDDGEEP